MAGIEDLIEVFRGEPLLDRKWPKFKADKITPEKMRGRWFTKSKDMARFFADEFPSVIKSAKIPIKSFNIGKKLQKASKLGTYVNPNEFLMPRNQLGKVKVNLLQTFLANAKALSPLAVKGLNTLASLPVATLTMVLQSTPANADEANMQLEDFANLAEEAQPKEKEMMAAGGIAGMLGEPRSGYQGGGLGIAKERWDRVKELFDIYKSKGGVKTIEEFGADILFEDRPGELPYFKEGGRIGLAGGMTPSESWMRDYFYSGKGGYDDSGMTFDFFQKNIGPELWYKHIGKAKGGRIGYDNGGPVTQEEYDAYVAEKEGAGEEPMDFETYKLFKIEFPGLAQGGRIGFQDGRGIMSRVGDMVDIRNVPYYSGKALQGLVNSAETLSKFPLAAGELGSKLLQQPPEKEMFMEAIENITPGSWSENLGLTSLVEDMEKTRPEDAQTVGGILGLGTEIAVPTGGAFKGGQYLLNKASKAMGKVKDGKTLNKLVEDKISDSGQSRRDFNIMVGTSGLVGALKWLGLGGLLKTTAKLKPSDDVVMRLRTFIDDSDDADGIARAKFDGALDIEGLSTAAAKTLKKIMGKDYKVLSGEIAEGTVVTGKTHIPKDNMFLHVPLDEGSYIADALKKAGHKVRLEHVDDMGGSGVDEILWRFKNDPMYKGTAEGAEKYKKFSEKVKKMTERERIEYHNSLTDDYGYHYSGEVEDLLDVLMPVKKAEGGRIGLGAGGPPLQLGIAESKWQAMHPVQGNKISQLKDAAMDRVFPGTGITGSLNMGNFEAFYNQPLIDPMNIFEKSENPQYGLQYEKGPFSAGVGVMPSGEREYGFKLRKEFNDGGLTKTIPPKRGPMPQGLPSALYNGIMRPRSY